MHGSRGRPTGIGRRICSSLTGVFVRRGGTGNSGPSSKATQTSVVEGQDRPRIACTSSTTQPDSSFETIVDDLSHVSACKRFTFTWIPIISIAFLTSEPRS